MKIQAILLLLAVAIGACTSGTNGNEGPDTTTEIIANAAAELEIRGMTCEVGCKKLIEKTVRKTAGVSKFDIDFENNSAHLEFDSTKISAEAVERIINGINNGAYTALVLDVAAL